MTAAHPLTFWRCAMSAQNTDEVVDNGDGTYSITPVNDGEWPPSDDGDWLIYDTGEGWTSSHPNDGWEGNPRWADPGQAAAAILGDPYPTRMWDGSTYAEWATANGVA